LTLEQKQVPVPKRRVLLAMHSDGMGVYQVRAEEIHTEFWYGNVLKSGQFEIREGDGSKALLTHLHTT
jgi:hypothetical protein